MRYLALTLLFLNSCSTLPPEPPSPALVAPTMWMLVPGKTLRENLDNWATSAGWELQWFATDPYAVTLASSLPGEFPAVLAPLARITELNICAHKQDRRVVVTDPRISCKEQQ